MSQFLNTDRESLSKLIPIISWKGKTLTQITSSIKKNPGNFATSSTNNRNLFLSRPLKIYRREIANSFNMDSCPFRASLSIDELNRPNGSIINSSSTEKNGLANTIDDTLSNNKCEKPGTCSVFLSPSENAKRRCRSSGMIKKSYNPSNNSSKYYTNSNQYLVSRNKTFQQNQYYFIRVGDPLLKPGPGLAAANIYSPTGITSCPKYNIETDCNFSYQWVDGQYYNVVVRKGYYTVDDFKGVFQVAMSENYHFVIKNSNGSKVFLINIIYNDAINRIQFQFTPYDNVEFPSSEYSCDIHASESWTHTNSGTAISPPNKGAGTSLIPGVKLYNNALLAALGFSSSTFPLVLPHVSIANDPTHNTQTYTAVQTITSNLNPGFYPVYKKIYYKPSNSKFAQQGAVTSSSLITRVKYDTVNSAAQKTSGNIYNSDYTSVYGSNIANALAYGVSENPYTMKNKLGFPNISYPSFPSHSTEQRNCTETSISGGVKFNR
jgi:hypothetical protein